MHSFRRVGAALAVMALGLSLPACIAAPFAIAPTRVSLAAGGARGAVLTAPPSGTAASAPERHPGATLFAFRAAIHPLQAAPELGRRLLDVGAGYTVDVLAPSGQNVAAYHGPYLELGVVPWQFGQSGGARGRVMFSGAAELLMTNLGQGTVLGAGSTVAARLEVFDFVSGPFAGAAGDASGMWLAAGGAHGEGGVGLELATSARVMQGEAFWTMTLGLTVRLPAAAGVVAAVFVPSRSGGGGATTTNARPSSGASRTAVATPVATPRAAVPVAAQAPAATPRAGVPQPAP